LNFWSLVGCDVFARGIIAAPGAAYSCGERTGINPAGRWGRMVDYPSIFARIVADPRYQRNLDWGQPRAGHPEGSIRAHIEELERNLEVLRPRVSADDAWRLRVLIHTHDTFKPGAIEGTAIVHARSHASLARKFLEEFAVEPGLLVIVQYHDEPYALWQQVKRRGTFDARRLGALLQRIHAWDLYLAFLIIDGCTAGKSRDQLHWFFRQVAGQVRTTFTEADIL